MPPAAAEPVTERLNSGRHDRSTFYCGVEPLDQYLQRQATQDASKGAAVTWVLIFPEQPTHILGYYTLAATSAPLSNFPGDIAKKLPRYPDVPATLLARLAVDRQQRKKRFGERLLLDALFQSLQVADSAIGSAAVVVDAKDEEAALFYEHFDFMRFPATPLKLFLPMATVRKTFAVKPVEIPLK